LSNTFSKEEKLKSRKLIEQLFAEGKHLNVFPLQMVYIPIEHTSNNIFQAGFSVSKRRFKLAVDRNRVKRLMRETYRLNKNIFTENHTKKHIFMFIYTTDKILSYQEINEAMTKLLIRFIQKI
jgi:ribonuclease P protein component